VDELSKPCSVGTMVVFVAGGPPCPDLSRRPATRRQEERKAAVSSSTAEGAERWLFQGRFIRRASHYRKRFSCKTMEPTSCFRHLVVFVTFALGIQISEA
jgi:hypothetical protein